jgi:hypothetical protein
MLKRNDIETILQINGAKPTDSDEEIRSILISARYNNQEVDTAMMILRENKVTHETKVEGLHKIFRSDESLKPEEISSLLGINVEIDEVRINQSRHLKVSSFQSILIVVFSVLLSLIGVFGSMYFYQVGIFHPAAAISFFGPR